MADHGRVLSIVFMNPPLDRFLKLIFKPFMLKRILYEISLLNTDIGIQQHYFNITLSPAKMEFIRKYIHYITRYLFTIAGTVSRQRNCPLGTQEERPFGFTVESGTHQRCTTPDHAHASGNERDVLPTRTHMWTVLSCRVQRQRSSCSE